MDLNIYKRYFGGFIELHTSELLQFEPILDDHERDHERGFNVPILLIDSNLLTRNHTYKVLERLLLILRSSVCQGILLFLTLTLSTQVENL